MAFVKKMQTIILGALVLSLLACTAFAADAASPAAKAQKLPDTPKAPQVSRNTVVSISHDGLDDIGTQLVFRLKELFNKSSLFDLSAKDEKKMRLVIKTSSEFPTRPEMGSVYSVVWTFSSGENVLNHYLASESGIVTSANVAAAAEALAGRTDAAAAKYAYLFE
ncbi:hypothetical protein [Desulfobaculum bizertense]|uniref:Lipoprotein n=1 Tax=Desulfobaculum bizertense DSM 18034 TaxID=1121442 RepID=A0A1T4VJV9_9BACT|nr:hypothetical protein [Desulfobaculum bizertense]SKA65175.1 hypothetical protein SAMN02745702_00488 [Desulfobaculum bizertense DSM 18034]